METIVLATAYLPPISWMAIATHAKTIRIEIHETYPKQTFRNRCQIATSSGLLNLTVPVRRVNGNHTKTGDIAIDNSLNWQQLHWRSIITAYNNTPYFLYYRDLFEPFYTNRQESLLTLNTNLIKTLLNILNFKHIEISNTSNYESKQSDFDFRNSFNSKKQPIQSITTAMPRYMQAFETQHGYLPDLSIIDLLFNVGPEAADYLKNIQFSNPVDFKEQ